MLSLRMQRVVIICPHMMGLLMVLESRSNSNPIQIMPAIRSNRMAKVKNNSLTWVNPIKFQVKRSSSKC